MFKKIIGATVLASALLLVGCGGGGSPTPAQVSKIDFGPKPKNIKVSKLRGAFDDFKDPDSIKIKLTSLPLKRGSIPSIGWNGWVATVEVNGKNSYGAYVGYKYYYVALTSAGEGFGSFQPGDRMIKVYD